MMMKKYLWILLSLLSIWGCESLEDTYGDYAGDGMIRYQGKCTDVTVSPGWERAILTWVNSTDQMRDKINVSWTLNGVKRDSMLPKDATYCSIPNLEDATYEVSVRGVAADGSTSSALSYFVRPYTKNHETVISFTRLIAKHYFIDNRLAFFFSEWIENIAEAKVSYYPEGETEPKELVLDQKLIGKKYFLLPDKIDPKKPVTLYRTGKIENCEDLIEFDPYVLGHDRLYTSEFRRVIKTMYGYSDVIPDAFADAQTELEIDHAITSFEDILNFPNLKTLHLGKNRYLHDNYTNTYGADAKLLDKDRSLFALTVLNEVCGLEVKRYNKHFLSDTDIKKLPFVITESNPQVPSDIACFDPTGWTSVCSVEDKGSWNSHLERLFDGDLSNWWEPETSGGLRTFEITLDMQKVYHAKGVQLAQKIFDPKSGAMEQSRLPKMIKISVSEDKLLWKNPTYVEDNILGATSGEINLIKFSEPQDIRFVKFIFTDQLYGKNFSATLAELGIF